MHYKGRLTRKAPDTDLITVSTVHALMSKDISGSMYTHFFGTDSHSSSVKQHVNSPLD